MSIYVMGSSAPVGLPSKDPEPAGLDGAVRLEADAAGLARLVGWAIPDTSAIGEPPDLAVEAPGLGIVSVTAILKEETEEGTTWHFAWPLPPILLVTPPDDTPHRVRVVHLGTGRDLVGSPLELATIAPVPTPPGPDLAEAPLSIWPRGLAGRTPAVMPVKVANGLWIAAQPPAALLRYELTFAEGMDGAPPARAARIVADTPARIALHMRPTGPFPPVGTPTRLLLRAWLPEAAEVPAQRHLEIWLTRREGGRFTPLRRLRRARVMRRPSEIATAVTLTEGEAAAADTLFLTLEVLEAKGLCALPPEILPDEAPVAKALFEDGRLAGAFSHLAELTRLHGEATAADHPLLPDGAIPPPAGITVSAAAAAALHPFTQVILPVYNGDEVVRDCLHTLKSAGTGPFQVVVVDDGSRSLTAEILRAECANDPRFVLHRRDENRGYTKSVNEGVLLTRADWVVVLNSDTLLPHGWLDRLHVAARARPGSGMVGPLSNAATWQSIPEVKRPDGSWSTNDMIGPRHLGLMQTFLTGASECAYPEFPVLNGFCTLIARAVFDRVGLYDEEAFPMGYGEETDLCLRARRAGFRLTVADDTFVYHHKSISFGSTNRLRLTRAGNMEMRNKHIGGNISAMEREMQRCPPLIRLRARMVDLLAELS